MTQEEILLNGLEYYSQDPMNRRCTVDGKCRYSPKTLGLKYSEGCFVGRLLDPKLALRMDKGNPGDCISAIIEDFSDTYELPEFMNLENSSFLDSCQSLHDGNGYWNSDTGLNGMGKIRLRSIIKDYKLDETKFEKFLKSDEEVVS